MQASSSAPASRRSAADRSTIPPTPGAEPLEIVAADGYRLGATLFNPGMHGGRAAVIHAAAGVPQTYYAKFAAYLAERGITVLTFDYRGIGRSAPPKLRGFEARMRDWALLDGAAALEYVKVKVEAEKLLAVGHSFGGQSLALVPGSEHYAAGLVVASQSGYWRNWRGAGRTGMWLLTHALLPGISRALGYFPMAALGQGEDLPAGVATEWAAWCRDPQYLVGHLEAHHTFSRFSAPLRFYAIDDDRYAPRRTVEALLELYPNASKEMATVSPSAHGGKAIGHFGFFREKFRDSLWREAGDWLLAV